MSGVELDSVNWLPHVAFNTASLTGSFAPLNGTGNTDDVKQLVMFNGSAVGVDISYDGVTWHDYWPPGGTMIFDFQANHAENPNSSGGTKYLRNGQIIYGRTASAPTDLHISFYR